MRAVGSGVYGYLGTGRLRVFVGTDPAAGAEIVEVIPAGKRWRPIAGLFSLVTGVAAPVRTVRMIMSDNLSRVFGIYGPSATQAASLNQAYNWALGVNPTAGLGPLLISFPDVPFFQGGWAFATNTLNLDPLDNFGPITLLVEEWDL